MTPATESRPRREIPWFEARVPRVHGDFTWVYLWGAPLRVMHWVSVFSIITLVVTGLYIGQPYFMAGGEASSHFLMGRFRFAHFLAAAIIVMAAIVRVYWLFVGNVYERWPALFPVTPNNLRNVWQVLKSYFTMRLEKQPHFVGHNPLAQLAYTTIYFVTAAMIFTGFSMYGQAAPGGFFDTIFGWLPPLVGGLQRVRLIHHALLWVYPMFVLIHVYLAIRADSVEHAGGVSSILTGGRFVSSHDTFEDFNVHDQPSEPWKSKHH